MSADNGIYVLLTKDNWKQVDEGVKQNLFGQKIPAYRVAHAQAIDNFDWYKNNEPHNVGYYLNLIWAKSPVFYDRTKAIEYAFALQAQVGYTEYGVCEINAEEFNFPNC